MSKTNTTTALYRELAQRSRSAPLPRAARQAWLYNELRSLECAKKAQERQQEEPRAALSSPWSPGAELSDAEVDAYGGATDQTRRQLSW
jgi:hypothetical protein